MSQSSQNRPQTYTLFPVIKSQNNLCAPKYMGHKQFEHTGQMLNVVISVYKHLVQVRSVYKYICRL